MKLCITANGSTLESYLDPRFGRCSFFLIVDSQTMQFKALPNDSNRSISGAGIRAAQIISNNDVNLLITGNIGPKAFRALSNAGIKIMKGEIQTANMILMKFKNGELNFVDSPTVDNHFGVEKKAKGWR